MSYGDRMTRVGDSAPPPNPQHVAWLKKGVESWNRRRKEEPFSPVLTWMVVDEAVYGGLFEIKDHFTPVVRIEDFSGVNLSGADLRTSLLAKGVFRLADFTGADLRKVIADRSDFNGADFRGAQLTGLNASEAVFRNAKFGSQRSHLPGRARPVVSSSDVTDVDFSRADFTDADFTDADLSGSTFLNADLLRANLVDATLTGATLTRSRLWRAKLLEGLSPDSKPPFGMPFEFLEVGSLGDLIDLQRHLREFYEYGIKRGQVALYFRGEPCSRSTVRPTVMRRGLSQFERELLISLKTEFPATFSGCEYAIDELAIARHFGLPSRLLDVTRSPLVGIYWATGEAEGLHRGFGCDVIECSRDCSCVHPAKSCAGLLHVFVLPRPIVCTFDSDRVSVVANFAQLPMVQRDHLLTKYIEETDFGYLVSGDVSTDIPRGGMNESMTTLLHNIRREKPYFADRVDIRDLFRVFVVEPRRSFGRIRAQSGAFMLSAFHEQFEGDAVAYNLADTRLYDHHVVTIPAGMKHGIREDLDGFAINAPALYADVESGAKDVTRRIRERAKILGNPFAYDE